MLEFDGSDYGPGGHGYFDPPAVVIAVTGSRFPGICPRSLVDQALDHHMPDYVHVGDCPTGADLFTREWCQKHGTGYTVHVADWDRHGRAAGPRRNAEMIRCAVNEGALFLLAFPGGRGTKNCTMSAIRAGLAVMDATS